jgi:hypothetical protein
MLQKCSKKANIEKELILKMRNNALTSQTILGQLHTKKSLDFKPYWKLC